MTVHEMPDRAGRPYARNMRGVSAQELSDALAELLHQKTGNCYVVTVDQISFAKDPNAYDSGAFSAKFERDTSAETTSPEEIADAIFGDE